MKSPSFRQARWDEPLIFELGSPGRRGYIPPRPEPEVVEAVGPLEDLLPPELVRREPPRLPEISEPEVVRHYTRLSQMNYCPDLGFYPLGSCTMKYNPKICDRLAGMEKVRWAHPYQDERTVQGLLALLYELKTWLAEITGTHEVSLLPAAGAHGELLGCL
ncbi:aminomethyl-transferring glycine dehydrogenase subunit GcvPB, partial [Candidatus Bathyarchaeota archaeon]